jgi:endonuclease-8
VRVRLSSVTHVVDINGPTVCELLERARVDSLIARIGPDVLRADADPRRIFARIGKSRAPIGQLLMDQSVIAGIGNIYRTEILWRCGLHPLMPGRAVAAARLQKVWDDARRLLAFGVEHNAIVTTENALAKPAKTRYRERVNIFGKSHCPRCGNAVRKFTLAARTAYVCETCQPAHESDE